jgi:hypothetical protein
VATSDIGGTDAAAARNASTSLGTRSPSPNARA